MNEDCRVASEGENKAKKLHKCLNGINKINTESGMVYKVWRTANKDKKKIHNHGTFKYVRFYLAIS